MAFQTRERGPEQTLYWGYSERLRINPQESGDTPLQEPQEDWAAVNVDATLVRDWGAPHPSTNPVFSLTAYSLLYLESLDKGEMVSPSGVARPIFSAKVSCANTAKTVRDTGISQIARLQVHPKSDILRFVAEQQEATNAACSREVICAFEEKPKELHLQFALTRQGLELREALDPAGEPWCITRALSTVETWYNRPPASHPKTE